LELDVAAVQAMLDKESVRAVSLRYTHGVDRHDGELLLSAYHPDAKDDHGAFIGSGADFVEHANRVHAQHWVCHQHYVTNQLIDLDGDTAHCESYFLAVLKRPDGICDLVAAATLTVSTGVKVSGPWLIEFAWSSGTLRVSPEARRSTRRCLLSVLGTGPIRPIGDHCMLIVRHAISALTDDVAVSQAQCRPAS